MQTDHNISHLPLVTFEYPDSQTSTMRRRHVRVTAASDKYVEGFEYSPAQSNTAATTDSSLGKFKKYLRSRLPLFGVSLVTYTKN
jgi:hypothetical protein